MASGLSSLPPSSNSCLQPSSIMDHFFLSERLQHVIGIREYPCNCLRSTCLTSQRIAVQGTLSWHFELDCGIPQGSCLSPLLCVIYALKLFDIIERHLPDALCYADNSQLYISFRLTYGLSSQTYAIQAMDIWHWMVSDRLSLNDENTEYLLIGTCQQLSKVEPLPLRVGTMDIEPVNCVRNPGAWFDSLLSMGTHSNKVCSSGF